MRFRSQDKRNILSNNRINFLIAIVFLLGFSIIYRLYGLQVIKYDLYLAKAEGQHQVYNILEPERGEIFSWDLNVDGGEAFYPFAANKDFADVYAIPCDIENPRLIADKLFQVFDRKKVEQEVAEYFKEKDKTELAFQLQEIAYLPEPERSEREIKIKNKLLELWQDPTWLKVREESKEKEIQIRKVEYIDNYLKSLDKKNDPYEPLYKKVDEDKLKELYAVLLSENQLLVGTSSLVIKDGKIYQKITSEKPDDMTLVVTQGISHIMKKYRYYPENDIGAQLIGFASSQSEEQRGEYGLEGFFDVELFGKFGEIRTERGAKQGVIIVNDREYSSPQNGNDLFLTINRSIQFSACLKLNAAVERYEAKSGTVIVMDPATGGILAMCSSPSYDPNNYNQVDDINIYNNPAIFEQYEPGSVFKTITMVAAIDAGKVSPSTTYQDNGSIMIEGWNKPIRNSDIESAGAHGLVDMNYVLASSLNTGSIFAMKQVGAENFADYVIDFGFGQKTGIELETEGPGNIESLLRKTIRPVEAATASFGQGITVTPLQMVNAYAAIANDGILMKPYIVKKITYDDGSSFETRPIQIRRVISEKAAGLILGMLANVVEGGHAKLAKVDGYYVGGKTGTAQVASKEEKGYSEHETIHNFIGLAPVSDPKFVMLVKLDSPKKGEFSSSTAAPLFSEIADFILNYYKVPKER